MTIKEARQANKLTQAETAKILKISKRTLEEWEAGNRNPKGGIQAVVDKINIIGMLTTEGREALAAGDVTFEEMAEEYKIQTAKKMSKWGAYSDTFTAVLCKIPECVVDRLNGAELAALIDAMKE